MPSCMKCHRSVTAASVLCGSCEEQAVLAMAELKEAVCGVCGWRSGAFYGRYSLQEKCDICQPMQILNRLTGQNGKDE